MFCSKCGKRCEEKVQYCPQCGNKFAVKQMHTANFKGRKYLFVGIIAIILLFVWIGIGKNSSDEEKAVSKENEVHTCVWEGGTCIEKQVCGICGKASQYYGQHSYDESGVCIYCNEGSSVVVALDFTNMEEYLSITSACTSFGRADVTVTPKKVANFSNVTISLQIDFVDKLGGTGTKTMEIRLDEEGNGSDYAVYEAAGKYNGRNPAIKDYTVTITAITGEVTE